MVYVVRMADWGSTKVGSSCCKQMLSGQNQFSKCLKRFLWIFCSMKAEMLYQTSDCFRKNFGSFKQDFAQLLMAMAHAWVCPLLVLMWVSCTYPLFGLPHEKGKLFRTFPHSKGHFFSDYSRSLQKTEQKVHAKLLNALFWTFKEYKSSILILGNDFQALKPQCQALKGPKRAISKFTVPHYVL